MTLRVALLAIPFILMISTCPVVAQSTDSPQTYPLTPFEDQPVWQRIDHTVLSQCKDIDGINMGEVDENIMPNPSAAAWKMSVLATTSCGKSALGLARARIYTLAVWQLKNYIGRSKDSSANDRARDKALKLITVALPLAKSDDDLVRELRMFQEQLSF